jgi:hypothetical protein
MTASGGVDLRRGTTHPSGLMILDFPNGWR